MGLIDTINDPSKYLDNLLEAFDGSFNSNTFLLKKEGKFLKSNLKVELTEFIKTDEFKQLMLKADIERDWSNYHEFNYGISDINSKPYSYVKDSNFFRPVFDLDIEELTYRDLEEYLNDLLLNKYIFHRWYSNEKMVSEIVSKFLNKL